NYFRAKKRISSGTVEGLNNKAKATMRKSYGFRTFRVLELSLYHALESSQSRNQPTISSKAPLSLCGKNGKWLDRSPLPGTQMKRIYRSAGTYGRASAACL